MRDNIITELNKRGIVCNAENITVNDMSYKGISIQTVKGPAFLTMKDITSIYDSVDEASKNINDEDNDLWKKTAKRLRVCIRPKSNDNIEKRNFLNLECYLRIFESPNGYYSRIIVPDDMTSFNVSADTVWKTAWENTKKTTTLDNLTAFVSDLNYDAFMAYTSRYFGAIAICDVDTINKLANKYNSNILIIPISINSVVFIPENNSLQSPASLANTLHKSNMSYNRYENLSYNIYRYNKEDNTITIIC